MFEGAERLLDVAGGVRVQSIDADRQIVEAGVVQPLDYSVAEKEPIRDDTRVGLRSGIGDDLGDFWMHQRLAAEHCDIGGPQPMQDVNSLFRSSKGTGSEVLSYSEQ